MLPPHWSHGNPIDIIGDAGPERYEQAVKIAANDPNTDGLLVIMTPQAMSDPVEIAKKLAPFAASKEQADSGQLDGWREGERRRSCPESRREFRPFRFPMRRVRAFHYMWRYSDNLRALYETPADHRRRSQDAADSASAV